MRVSWLQVLIFAVLSAQGLFAVGDGTLDAPLRLGATQNPVMTSAGDFNRDGRPDLATVNGSSQIMLLLQGRTRLDWTPAPAVMLGVGNFFVRALDFNGDGADDLAVGDPASYAHVALSRGDGSFERAVALTEARGSRSIAAADLNGDGVPDLVSANHSALTYSVFWGKGDGTFAFAQATLALIEPHAAEAMDFDGDGDLDLMIGLQALGILPLRSQGNGSFDSLPVITNLGCVRYIASGDFNGDRKADLASSCRNAPGQNGTANAGVSMGDGAYSRTLNVEYDNGSVSVAIADLDRDGFDDLALTNSLGKLEIHPARSDGTFRPKLDFQANGARPGFLTTADLDRDGLPDLISSDSDDSSVTVFWGTGDDLFIQSVRSVRGFGTTKAVALGDLDGDSRSDLFVSQNDFSRPPGVHVYLRPGENSLSAPSLTIPTSSNFSALLTADFDRDGTPDLAGVNSSGGLVLVEILERSGSVRREQTLQAGALPGGIAAGNLNQDSWLDLAVASTGSGAVLMFLNREGSEFAESRAIPTIEVPRDLAVGDLDRDGLSDLAVASSTRVAIQYGLGGEDFGGPVLLADHPAGSFSKVVLADLEGDGRPDLAASEGKSRTVFLWRGKGNREFSAAEKVGLNGTPSAFALADMDSDGYLDIAAGYSNQRWISILLARPGAGFSAPVDYRSGSFTLGLAAADLDLDGALEVLTYHGSNVAVLRGHSVPAAGRFRRGDANGDGELNLTDPIVVLGRLFLGGDPLPCQDAADANDDGELNLTDPIAVLNRLFLGSEPLPPPGPEKCGSDETVDGLPECRASC